MITMVGDLRWFEESIHTMNNGVNTGDDCLALSLEQDGLYKIYCQTQNNERCN